MITVGFDFGTHQTKICHENVEAGTAFYDVFRFKDRSGEEHLTLPSYIRIRADGTVRYGHDAVADDEGGRGQAITYFKQKMFSLTASSEVRAQAEQWSVLYLAYIIFKLDERFRGQFIVQMGMPTDADPQHYAYCKSQAVKVMGAAMLLARRGFKGNLGAYLQTPCFQLLDAASKCIEHVPRDIHEARKQFPVFVFPEAYVALIPLINDHRLPTVGPNLFVDIGGGTVDISFFTNQMDGSTGRYGPCLYYYHSIPYGLNMITGQDLESCHNVQVGQGQITGHSVDRFRGQLSNAVNEMMSILRQKFIETGKTNVMPFENLCAQILHGRPICYSGGGSMFQALRLTLQKNNGCASYHFSQVTTVAELINHSKLYIENKMFHVLATAFALSHRSLTSGMSGDEPDSIRLVSVDKLFSGLHIPQVQQTIQDPWQGKWERKKSWNW